MKTKFADFSFEESLKYIDEVMGQLKDESPLPVCDTLTKDDMLAKDVSKIHCTVMMIRVATQERHKKPRKGEYVFHTTMNLMMNILRSTKNLRHLDAQTGGGLLALFDTPMKKDVEEIINLSAMVRSINDVVLKKFHQGSSDQKVTVGMDYGSVVCYNGDDNIEDLFFAGKGIETAKLLTDLKENCVAITGDVYINLTEEMQNNLFARCEKYHEGEEDEVTYHYAPLINIRMQKWVEEGK